MANPSNTVTVTINKLVINFIDDIGKTQEHVKNALELTVSKIFIDEPKTIDSLTLTLPLHRDRQNGKIEKIAENAAALSNKFAELINQTKNTKVDPILRTMSYNKLYDAVIVFAVFNELGISKELINVSLPFNPSIDHALISYINYMKLFSLNKDIFDLKSIYSSMFLRELPHIVNYFMYEQKHFPNETLATNIIDAIDAIDSFDYRGTFPNLNIEVIKQISEAEKEKTRNNELLLVNLDLIKNSKYTKRTAAPDNSFIPKWTSSINISETSIYTNSWKDNFTAFTCGVFQTPINPKFINATFEWKNLIIAGGAVRNIMYEKYQPNYFSDVDIFVYGNSLERREKLKYLLNWFSGPNTYYSYVGCVVGVLIKNIKRRFQIIITNATSAYEILNTFDFSYIQYAIKPTFDKDTDLYNLNLVATAAAAKTTSNGVATLQNVSNMSAARITKCFYNGFAIKFNAKLESFFNIKEEFCDRSLVSSYIQEFNTVFYLTDETIKDIPNENIDLFIQSMMSATTKLKNSTKDPESVLTNVSYDGLYVSDYSAASVDNLDYSLMTISGDPRVSDIPIKGLNGGHFIYSAENIQFKSANQTKSGCEISFDISGSPKFQNFINSSIGEILKALKIESKLFILKNPVADGILKINVHSHNVSKNLTNFAYLDNNNVTINDLVANEPLDINFILLVNKRPDKVVIITPILVKVQKFTNDKSREEIRKMVENKKLKNKNTSVQVTNEFDEEDLNNIEVN